MGNCQTVQNGSIQIPRQGVVSQICISNFIWSKKYMGLYDYEAVDIRKKKFKVQGNALISKKEDSYILLDDKFEKGRYNQEILKQSVFRLTRNDNYYQLMPIIYEENKETMQRPIWLVVKSLPGKSYSIRERDILKLGKQKMRVREVIPADSNQSVIVNDNIRLSKTTYEKLQFDERLQINQNNLQDLKEKQKNPLVQLEQTVTINEEDTCRICLEPGLLTNPLITPCKCSGSVRHIHLLCLKSWLAKQIKAVITDFCVTINWKPLCCQMCKTQYKYRIYLDNQKFYTVDIPKPEKPYIVLQVVKKRSSGEGKIFKFITFKNKNTINIGRKKDVDVKISEDISVSRVHATLKYNYQKREFVLQDNKSKFGTLVLAKNGLLLRPHQKGISVQIGAELFQFEPMRQISNTKAINYQISDNFIREEEIEMSENDDEQGVSEQEDEVNDLPQDIDRSPILRRSSSVRRSQSLQINSSEMI